MCVCLRVCVCACEGVCACVGPNGCDYVNFVIEPIYKVKYIYISIDQKSPYAQTLHEESVTISDDFVVPPLW